MFFTNSDWLPYPAWYSPLSKATVTLYEMETIPLQPVVKGYYARMLRAAASHKHGWGLNPGLCVICRLN